MNQASIASRTGIGQVLNAGTYNISVTGGVAQTPSAGDKVMVILRATNAAAHSDETVGFVPDQTIDSPFTPPAAAAAYYFRKMGQAA